MEINFILVSHHKFRKYLQPHKYFHFVHSIQIPERWHIIVLKNLFFNKILQKLHKTHTIKTKLLNIHLICIQVFNVNIYNSTRFCVMNIFMSHDVLRKTFPQNHTHQLQSMTCFFIHNEIIAVK